MKSKKVLTILLSMAIMLTFMPTFAFADVAVATGGHSFDEIDSVDVDYEGLKVLVEPTCEDYGAGEITCTTLLNGEECGAVKTVKINPLNHQEPGDRVRLKADEIMDKMGGVYATDEFKANWHDANPELCEGYVYLCKECGKPIYQRRTGGNWHLLSGSTEWTNRVEWTGHTEPTSGITKCDKYFTCTVCGYEYSEDADHNSLTDHVEGALKTEDVFKHASAEKRVKVTKTYCEECGYVSYSDPVAQKYNKKPHEEEGQWEDEKDQAKKLAEFDHSKTTRVVTKPATCMEQGAYEDVCDECGYVVESGVIEKTAHTYATITYEDGGYVWSGQYCTFCLANNVMTQKPGTTDKKIDFVPDDVESLTYTEIAPANCEQGAFVLRTYKWNNYSFSRVMSDKDVEEAIAGDPEEGIKPYIVEVGGKFYDISMGTSSTERVEVPYARALGHDFGAITTYAEATCTEADLEAKVCSKCNKVDHGTVQHVGQALGHDILKVEHAATCGDWGSVEETCQRCKEYQKKTLTDKPVVAEGAECKFEWKVTKVPTATEDGEKALVCTVCGAVKDGSQTVVPKDSDEAKEAVIAAEADPAIKAASDVIANAAAYKDASVDAVKEAKANLNQAIAAGTAADVSRAAAKLNDAVKAAAKKDANKMAASAKKIKASKKKTKKFSAAKAFTVSGNAGAVTYAKASGNKKITVAADGTVKVKKGLKKGKTYKVKVNVTDAGNGTTLGATKQVVLKVKIKK